MAKSRKFSESYLKMGFIFVFDNGKEKSRCVLCCSVHRNEAIQPSKLKRHLHQKHAEHVEKDLDFFHKTKSVVETAEIGC